MLGLEKKLDYIAEADNLLRKVDLFDYKHLHPLLLSGGQKHKLLIAAILIHRPALLILDEPFFGLDPISIRQVIDLINQYRREYNPTIVITDQNHEIIGALVDRFIDLDA